MPSSLQQDDYTIRDTPWGQAEHIKQLTEGIFEVSTAGHGGIRVFPEPNQRIPDYMRADSGWYEQDVEWAKVAVVFPESFEANDVKAAHNTLKNWRPDAYERFTGRSILPGESYIRDRNAFEAEHARDWIVTAAWGDWASWVPEGMIGVAASIGGRDSKGQSKGEILYFLVPAAEYEQRSYNGFVVDRCRHTQIDGSGIVSRVD
ncbi:DUF7007 domain-containing protein [Edaphobacter dinghuensis]|uniref:DUF7007 domain-containing protein n=1 Tax=Edaphobacter dinghuensis TaxID=1560005 RepID=A0A917MB72_9BACT|nr:hypothetical protein [Edaphobacter dinghuensis]GGG86661.1 hypothetical protein GCM10011585_33290 [Edaphobacter dinghuensis]